MDATAKTELKWQTNREKVTLLKEFPGRFTDPAGMQSKRIHCSHTIGVDTVLAFTDGTFIVLGPSADEPAQLANVLESLRDFLEIHHATALARLDALTELDETLKHQARKEKLLGAIRNNIAIYPELLDDISALLHTIRDEHG